VRVVGHLSILGDLSITSSDGVNIGDKFLGDGEVILPVKLLSHHAGPHTVTVSLPTTGQTVTASLFPLVSSCPDREYTGIVSAILSDLLLYYQSVLVIVLAALLAGYFTFKNLKPAPATCTPAPKPVPATPNIQKPEEVGGTYLWTQDKSPIYGSPIFRRSPPTGARNLTQYSYN